MILFVSYIISYASEAYSCDVTIEFTPIPSWFVYNVFNAQPLQNIVLPACKGEHILFTGQREEKEGEKEGGREGEMERGREREK